MTKKYLLIMALLVIVLSINNTVFASANDLQSEEYGIYEYNGEKYILGIAYKTEIEEIEANLKCDKQMAFYNENSEVASNDYAKTGMYVKIGDEKYYIVAGLDVNKDGDLSSTDLYQMCRYLVGIQEFNNIEFLAADANLNDEVTCTDVLITKKLLVDFIDKNELYKQQGSDTEFEYVTNIATKTVEIKKLIKLEQEKVFIPEQIGEKDVVSLSEEMFDGDNNIKEIEISKNISKIPNKLFIYCDRLEKIIVDEDNKTFYSNDGILLNKNATEIIYYPSNKHDENYTIPENVTKIKTNAFLNTKNLNNLHIGRNIEAIEEKGIFNFIGTIHGFENSVAINYAKTNNIKYEIIIEHEDGIEVENTGVYLIPPVDPAVTEVRGAYSPPPGNYGIDIARKDGRDGEKVYASMSGNIIEHRWPGYMTIENDKQTVKITYVHMDNMQFSLGAKVKQGDYVGTIGHQGLAANAYPRVDFELWVKENGEYVSKNPTRYAGH